MRWYEKGQRTLLMPQEPVFAKGPAFSFSPAERSTIPEARASCGVKRYPSRAILRKTAHSILSWAEPHEREGGESGPEIDLVTICVCNNVSDLADLTSRDRAKRRTRLVHSSDDWDYEDTRDRSRSDGSQVTGVTMWLTRDGEEVVKNGIEVHCTHAPSR